MVKKSGTQTTPNGAEIPVPKRRDVLRALKKAAKRSPKIERG